MTLWRTIWRVSNRVQLRRRCTQLFGTPLFCRQLPASERCSILFEKVHMSEKQRKIYQSEGDRYEALISREDHQGNIPRAIDEIIEVDDLDILDLGAGTGRLALLLARRAKSMRAFDASAEMLRVCRDRLIASGLTNWQVNVADHRQ